MGEEPSQTFQQFSTSSTGVMQYLKNQLASFGLWSNIPGRLTKISTSPKGYVWGYNSTGELWTCKEPCTDGKWQNVGFGSKPLDIATDDMYVYILHTTKKIIMMQQNTASPQITMPAMRTRCKLVLSFSPIILKTK